MPSNSLVGLWFWLFFEIQVKGCVGQTAEGSQPLLFSSLHSELLHFTDNSEYDIVTAYEVDQNGDYISHAIAHHERRKRSISGRSTDSLHLHLHLQGFGHDFQLDLKTSNFLLAPGFTIQTLGKGRTKTVQTFPSEDFCFYQGILRLHENSTVALSTCGGLNNHSSEQVIKCDDKIEDFACFLIIVHNFITIVRVILVCTVDLSIWLHLSIRWISDLHFHYLMTRGIQEPSCGYDYAI